MAYSSVATNPSSLTFADLLILKTNTDSSKFLDSEQFQVRYFKINKILSI